MFQLRQILSKRNKKGTLSCKKKGKKDFEKQHNQTLALFMFMNQKIG